MKKDCGFPQPSFITLRHRVTTHKGFVPQTTTPSLFDVADVMYRLGVAHEVFAQAMAVAQ
jgi:hypothetical protein